MNKIQTYFVCTITYSRIIVVEEYGIILFLYWKSELHLSLRDKRLYAVFY